MGRSEDVQAWALVLGEPERAASIAEALRGVGFRTTVAVTVSEVRELMVGGCLPTLAIVDARTVQPWRLDAVERMMVLVVAAAIRVMRVGGVPRPHDDAYRVLPASATVADIVAAARSAHGQAATEPAAPELVPA